VRLRVRQADGQDVDLALPSTRACPELVERLAEVVGEQGSAVVDETSRKGVDARASV
jgi:hypothetical protein